MKKSDLPVVVEQAFEKSVYRVWKAITDVSQMRCWYFDNIPAFDAQVGFVTQFSVSAPSRDFVHVWRITEVIGRSTLVYDWTYAGLPGKAIVSFELTGGEDSSQLKLTNTVVEDFPDGIPEFSRENCIGGWTYFINQKLKAYLDG